MVMSEDTVQRSLDRLVAEGMAIRYIGAQGEQRYRLTPEGKRHIDNLPDDTPEPDRPA